MFVEAPNLEDGVDVGTGAEKIAAAVEDMATLVEGTGALDIDLDDPKRDAVPPDGGEVVPLPIEDWVAAIEGIC